MEFYDYPKYFNSEKIKDEIKRIFTKFAVINNDRNEEGLNAKENACFADY